MYLMDEELNKIIKDNEAKKIMSTKKINLYPNGELRKVIVEEAKKVDRSVNKFCLLILRHHLIDSKAQK